MPKEQENKAKVAKKKPTATKNEEIEQSKPAEAPVLVKEQPVLVKEQS